MKSTPQPPEASGNNAVSTFTRPATGSDAMLAAPKQSEVDMDQRATAPIRFSCFHPVAAHPAAAAQAREATNNFRI